MLMDNNQSTVNSSDDDDHNDNEKSGITKFWCLFKDTV